jgi:outer membrane receptor protein involved in Fe transport
MAAALASLARQARVDLLFDRQLVRGLTAPPVRGRLPADVALGRILTGSGVGYRVTADGAFVLYKTPAAPPAVEAGDGAIAELLVVGRRTQNVDIRRTENDIQPYRVLERSEIEASGRSTVDELLRARESANTRAGSPTLTGETRSKIDLRGFGEASTLVLVDGRRMPFFPSPAGEFLQADINGVPLGAIERIEILTTTAGGIYGPGAIGGVVNLVLRRDYRGADLTVYSGVTDRGDAEEARFEARLGFTPDDGTTDVMLFVSESRAASLRVGERTHLQRASARAFANDPEGYAALLPIRNGVAIASLGGDLTLDAAYGGAALGSRYTFLPIGFAGTRAEAAAQLVANAGQLPMSLSDDLNGRRADLTMAPHITSGLLNVRRRLGSGVEVFLDGFYSRSRGHMVDAFDPGPYGLGAGRPTNPFAQDVLVSFPQGLSAREFSTRADVGRGTVGLIADLPRAWKGSADYTVTRATFRGRERSTISGLTQAVLGPIEVLGDWQAVLAALPAYAEEERRDETYRGRSRDLALRLAGPLLTLPGGPLTMTLLGEEREDRVPESTYDFFGLDLVQGARSQRVRSGYLELRAPIGASDSDLPWLRGLEAQLAVRHDRLVQRGPTEAILADPTDRFSVHSDSTTFIAGARVSPIRAIMLRGSFATGERPPSLSDLQALSSDFIFINGPPDPRRGGRVLRTEAPLEVLLGGSLRVTSARAESMTFGAVLNPDGRRGPRLSLDYSRIVVSREPTTFRADATALLAAEATYPQRVVRAPTTAADLAAGFAVGPVVLLDFASDNNGRSVVEAVDGRLDWRLPDLPAGDLRLYGGVTWQPRLRRTRLGDGEVNRANKLDGPLTWRGNAGVEWAVGETVLDVNAQYYGRYSVAYADSSREGNAQQVRFQGAAHVPAQVYVDLSLRRRLTLQAGFGMDAVDVRLSVLNLLDHAPPILAPPTSFGFSEYGDPRRRRVTLALSTQF